MAHQYGRVLRWVPLPRPAGLDSVLSLRLHLYRTPRIRKWSKARVTRWNISSNVSRNDDENIAWQVAVGISHAANCHATWRKVEDCSFLATCCLASCKEGMPHVQCSPATCLATLSRCKLQGCALRSFQSHRVRLKSLPETGHTGFNERLQRGDATRAILFYIFSRDVASCRECCSCICQAWRSTKVAWNRLHWFWRRTSRKMKGLY